MLKFLIHVIHSVGSFTVSCKQVQWNVPLQLLGTWDVHKGPPQLCRDYKYHILEKQTTLLVNFFDFHIFNPPKKGKWDFSWITLSFLQEILSFLARTILNIYLKSIFLNFWKNLLCVRDGCLSLTVFFKNSYFILKSTAFEKKG